MWLGLTLAAFALTFAFHALLCRVPLRLDFVAKAVVVAAAIGLSLAATLIARGGLGIETVAALLLYAFLFELYVFFFTLVSTSVSVALLLKLRTGALTPNEIDSLYSDAEMVSGRMEKMLGANLLTKNDNQYRITQKARMLVVPFRVLRFFFHSPTKKLSPHAEPHQEA